jgi:hypothetical protein
MRKSVILLNLLLLTSYIVQAKQIDEEENGAADKFIIDKSNKFGIYGGMTYPALVTKYIKEKGGSPRRYIQYDEFGRYGFHLQSFYTLYLNKNIDLEFGIGYHQKKAGYHKYFEHLESYLKHLLGIRDNEDDFKKTTVIQTLHHLRFIITQFNIFLFVDQVKSRIAPLICGAYIDYLMSITTNEQVAIKDKVISTASVTQNAKARLGKKLDSWNYGFYFGTFLQFESGVTCKLTLDIGIQSIYDLDLCVSPANIVLCLNGSLGYNFGKLLT